MPKLTEFHENDIARAHEVVREALNPHPMEEGGDTAQVLAAMAVILWDQLEDIRDNINEMNKFGVVVSPKPNDEPPEAPRTAPDA